MGGWGVDILTKGSAVSEARTWLTCSPSRFASVLPSAGLAASSPGLADDTYGKTDESSMGCGAGRRRCPPSHPSL